MRYAVIWVLPLCAVLLGGSMMGSALVGAQEISLPNDPPPPTAFQSCIACHSVKPDAVSFGPNLRGVFGRKAGSMAGYAYSDAMTAADFTWDAERLDAWITQPKHVVRGTKMPFPGLRFAERRQEIIAYLASLK